MKVLTSVVNNLDFIDIQYHTLKKYLKCDYEFIVFNDAKPFADFTNGNDATIHEKINQKCKEYNIQCIHVPNGHHKNMDCPVVRCAEAMNFMYDYMLKNIDEYLIIDSDMFLIDDLYMERYKDYSCAIVLQKRESLGDFSYIWNGLFYFNLFTMKNPELINWEQILNSDVGGLTYTWLILNCDTIPSNKSIRQNEKNIFNHNGIYFIKHLWSLTWDSSEIPQKHKNSELENFLKNDPRNKNGKYYCEIYDDIFLHYRGGGDWNRMGLDFHNNLTQKLKNVLLNNNNSNNNPTSYKNVFTKIYEENIWQNIDNENKMSKSGEGSNIDYNMTSYVPFLKNILIKNKVESVVDLGCGDFLCGPFIYNDLNITYSGYDIYDKIIDINKEKHKNMSKYKFTCLDILNDWEKIDSADICIIKDVLQHWKLKDIYSFLDNICLSKKFKYILICNCCDQKYDNEDAYSVGAFRQLSAKFYPLKRYDATIVFKYHTKEISIIKPPF